MNESISYDQGIVIICVLLELSKLIERTDFIQVNESWQDGDS